MSLQNLSLLTLLLGLLGLAAILFLLQRLRVRYQEQTVITTLFWKQALEEARARVLTRRFKHLWAYLFVLLIAALMWLGFADPKFDDDAQREHVVLLDGSANMGRGSRFRDTVALVKARLESMPRDRRRVILCGGRPQTVLQPGENALLLDARLEGVTPEACAATVDATLRAMTSNCSTVVVVAGSAPIGASTRELLPDHVQLERIAAPMNSTSNAGITALGVGRSSSGAWEKVDIICEVLGSESADPAVTVSMGGRALQLAATRTRDGNRSRILLSDVPATGEVLTVTLTDPDALAADNTASIRVPKRARIRVALAASVETSVGPVLRADSAVLLTNDNPDVVVRGRGEVPQADLPTLEFVPVDAQEEAFLLYHPDHQASQTVLLESFAQLGLSEVDAMDMAQASGQTIAIGAAPAARRGIGVWAPLLSEQFNFVQSRSFPLFVAQAVRWLAGVEADRQFVAAGDALAGDGAARVDAAGRKLDPVGADFVPPRAGTYRRADGDVVVASLTSPATTLPRPPAGSPAGHSEGTPARMDRGLELSLWLAASILVTLLLEWFLFRTGRMP